VTDVLTDAVATEFSAFDKAVKKVTGELETLLAFYDFPAEHRVHLRTTNPIESTFSTVRLSGLGSHEATASRASSKSGPGDGLQAPRRWKTHGVAVDRQPEETHHLLYMLVPKG
jgi:hypothetical protein